MNTIYKSSIFFFICCAIVFFILFQLIDFNGLYGQDSHAYLRYTKHLKNHLSNFTMPNDYFWPVMYPLIGSLLSLTSIPEMIILQIISLIAFTITALYIIKTINILYNMKGNIYVFIFFIFSPIVFRFGSVIMSDMLCLCFLSIGFYHLIKYENFKNYNNLLYCVSLFSLAFYTRYISVTIFILPFLFVSLKNIKSQPIFKYFLLFIPIIIISLPHLIIKSASMSTFKHPGLLNWSLINFFKNEFITGEGTRSYIIPNSLFVLIQNFHPRYFFGGILLIPFFKRKDFNITLLLGILTYLFFLTGIPSQNTRFFLLSFPLFLIIMFPAYRRLSDKFNKQFNFIKPSLLIIQIILMFYSFSKVYKLNKIEKRNVSQINQISNYKTIYTSGYEDPLRSYSDKDVFSIWNDSIKLYEKPALFMINDVEMTDVNLSPIIKHNYNLIRSNSLKELRVFKNGWKLYEIQ